LRIVSIFICGLSALSAAGCASIVDGSKQTITVSSSPDHADCTLSRNGIAIAHVASTPGTAEIEKTHDDILVACSKDGYQSGNTPDAADVDAVVFGNLILGGLIGITIDAATGAADKYDSEVHVTLAQRSVFGVAVAALDQGFESGVRVVRVRGDSAAAKAGIAVGDILVSLDGEKLSQKGDIQRVVASRQPGAIVSVHLVRNGAPIDLATQL
jgi:hypothetical protein